jgi:hypothetical protein
LVVRVRLLALPAIVVCVLALALAPSVAFGANLAPSCGHANTNNPGQHKGLFKNGCLKLPPPPAPNPPPVVGGQSGGQGSASGLIPSSRISPGPLQVSQPTSHGHRAVSFPILSKPQVAAIPWSDRNLWIVTALLPSLLVLWLLIAGRAAADALQKRGGQVVSAA